MICFGKLETREDLEEEISLLCKELEKPSANKRENAKYRERIEDAVNYLQRKYLSLYRKAYRHKER